MASHLERILFRLIEENLPATCFSHSLPLNSPGTKKLCPHATVVDEPDIDALDPRWYEMFVEYFLKNSDEMSDDMLFFVKQLSSEDTTEDPVFVRRRQADSSMPPFDELIVWKETFFLNLIVQLNCKLRVSVCRKGFEGQKVKESTSAPSKFLKMVIKRVYALPSRSRVDSKELQWECSYPLIYYAVEDHDDMFDQLLIGDGEHLCVELLCSLSNDLNDDVPLIISKSDIDGENKGAMLGKRPATTSCLFQGAATYKALLKVLAQKLALRPSRRSKVTNQDPVNPEYIIMRGPEGKGHAQVALTLATPNPNSSLSSLEDRSIANESLAASSPAESPKASPQAPSLLQSLKRLSLSPVNDKRLEVTEEFNSTVLSCSITFVNIPWTSIICDLLKHVRRYRIPHQT